MDGQSGESKEEEVMVEGIGKWKMEEVDEEINRVYSRDKHTVRYRKERSVILEKIQVHVYPPKMTIYAMCQ